MPHRTLSSFNLDLVRASLGPALAAHYAMPFGAAPWLTAGTLSWPAASAEPALASWLRWSRRIPSRTFSAVRLGACDLAIDVAVVGDPWGATARLSVLRAQAPADDTVALSDLRMLRSQPCLATAELPMHELPSAAALLDVAADVADGICFGVRRAAGESQLIALGEASEHARLVAALDQVARGLGAHGPVPTDAGLSF